MSDIEERGRGRPKKPIDYEMAKKLAGIQCTQEEIAAFLGLSVDTLMRDEHFCGIYKEGVHNGRMSLRRHQWRALENGNSTMLVWLGKQYLGQRDKWDIDADLTVRDAIDRPPQETREQWLRRTAGELITLPAQGNADD